MTMITAIIRPQKLNKVYKALHDIGIEGITCTEVEGVGKQKGKKEIYRGTEVDDTFIDKIKIEIAVHETPVQKVIDTIVEHAKTKKDGVDGAIGDGKIFVMPITQVVRIRTGEQNEDAL